jgi:4-amino-4-deoxy-L-arabinose transferase-like glycosyltransferase
MKKKKTGCLNRQKYFWLLAFSIFIFLRLPSVFEPFTYGDEGIYLALGQALRKGLVFYRDIHDNKPPLLYLIAGLAGNFKTYRLIYFFWSAIGFFIFKALAEALFPKNKKSVAACFFSFAILGAIPFFEGQIANAENFLIYTSSAAFLLLITKSESYFNPLLAGFLFSLSALFKIPAAFDLITALVVFFLLQKKNLKEIISSFFKPKFWLLITGFIIPIALSGAYYLLNGAGSQYFTAAFGQNIPYLSSWTPDKPQALSLPLPLILRALIILVIIIGLFIWRKKKSFSTALNLILVWFGWTIFAALLSSRPYPHYLFQAMPAICLSLGFLFSTQKLLRFIPLVFAVVISYTMITLNYYHYQTLTYYQNFYSHLLGQKTSQEYISFWGDHVSHLYRAGAYLKSHTQPEEKIFIWGDHPELYPLAERLPIGRYAAAYHVKDFDKNYQETLTALRKNPPRFFVVFDNEINSLNQFYPFLEENYSLIKSFEEIKIFLKNPG